MSNTINPGADAGGLVTTFIAAANNNNNGTARNGGGGATAASGGGGSGGSWYEALSRAWGQTLDAQASRITELSGSIGGGGDQPSNMVALTAESLRMQFVSNSAATSQNSVGEALNALARK
ncbi:MULTISPECIES: hypothetical protein [Lysobacter]|jgi:hypothetical protein|uniref:hypothetical protein n=1 Tax=Lysobacter TaxID=68 RepID=UPI00068DBA96|nr:MULTISPECIES: hypothetical protein [Lysobacter]ALN64620.1 hypothetical protein GLA29479_3769 [Lysobacter antibioticus]